MTVFEAYDRFSAIYDVRLTEGLEDNRRHERRAVADLPLVKRGMLAKAGRCDNKILRKIAKSMNRYLDIAKYH